MRPVIFVPALRWVPPVLLAAVLLVQAVPSHAQSLQVSTATELRATPALNAKALRKLPAGTALVQLESKGGWVRVKAGNREGWVRLTHVRAPAAAAAAANPITGLTGLFSADSNRPTATTGIRGLSEERLANAEPAPAQVKMMENYAVTPAQAQQHARAGKLSAQTLPDYEGAP